MHSIAFFIDGSPATLSDPISGMDLYAKAGKPTQLWDGKKLIPKTWQAYLIGNGAKLTTTQPKQ